MKKKIRNKTKLFGLFVSVLAAGTVAAAMSEHVTEQLVLMMDAYTQATCRPNRSFHLTNR